MDDATSTNSKSGSDFWGAIDGAIDGLSGTGGSILEGAGNLAGIYEAYFGGRATVQPEQTVDKTNELRQQGPGEASGPASWFAGNSALFLLLGVTGLVALVLIARRG